jgi:2,3-bisphosphoglycerate-independent phosphoglycerate mutase
MDDREINKALAKQRIREDFEGGTQSRSLQCAPDIHEASHGSSTVQNTIERQFSKDSISNGVRILSEGDAIIAPTETVYGLFCDATSDIATQKVYDIKGRPACNPLIVHVSSVDMALLYATIHEQDAYMMELFWNKLNLPITFVVPLAPGSQISKLVTAGLKTVAIRRPNHPIALSLIEEFGKPLAAPSANTSMMLSPTSYDMVMEDIGRKVRLVIDGGPCDVGIESTIIDITTQGEYRILRHGGTPIETIEEVICGKRSDKSKNDPEASSEKSPITSLKAPGMMKRHYAPSIPLRMDAAFPYEGEAFIAFGKTPVEHDANLSETGDLAEAAYNLYSYIKAFDDKEKYSGIAVMSIPQHGLGVGINDRLRRASSSNNNVARVLLVILDGFGISEKSTGNATIHAEYIQSLMKTYPCTRLNTHGKYVGLPDGQFGNSEVGHMTIGAGRINKQKLPLINDAIASGEFNKNPVLQEFLANTAERNGACHIMGLFSNGGVHSHIDHFFHCLQLLRNNGIQIKAHLFLDGRDVQRDAALGTLSDAISSIKIRNEEIASVHGRYYAMDRDKKWERSQISLDAIIKGESKYKNVDDPIAAIRASYGNVVYDEEMYPFVMRGYHGATPNDSFWMINFRTDRIKQILTLIQAENFDILNMVSIDPDIDSKSSILFPTVSIQATLGEVIAKNGLKQIRIAETEKYAHVTYFINGGKDVVYENEDRVLVPSPKVIDYSETPDMSSADITENLDNVLKSAMYDLVIANYASPDMIGHTGNYEVAVTSIKLLDGHLRKIVQTAISSGYNIIITADHGNIENMINDDDGTPCKTHSFSQVPFIYIPFEHNRDVISNDGSLEDVAPTILDIMGLEKPEEMTGRSLLLMRY